MKNLLYILLFLPSLLLAQAPEGVNYQALIRDASGVVVANQNVGIQLSLLQGSASASASGSAVYKENFSPTTNDFGLVNLQIGAGTPTLGTFSSIDWSNGTYFIETAVDVSGGTSYVVISTTQFMSVPYALYAKNAGNNSSFDFIYPDGKSGIIPLISIPNNYSPPSGKRLYVTQLYSNLDLVQTNNLSTFNYTGSIETYIVPQGISNITIEANGAQGGTAYNTFAGGRGAMMKGDFFLNSGEVIKIVVGQLGGSSSTTSSGGGGGSFVWIDGSTSPLIVAGGGGGGGNLPNGDENGTVDTNGKNGTQINGAYNGNPGNGGVNGQGGAAGGGGHVLGHAGGGAGWLSDGGGYYPGRTKYNFSGGSGGNTNGGFGGGGGIHYSGAGGGGGYSGGGGSGWASSSPNMTACGGGGGSFNGGTNQLNLSGENLGNGSVSISLRSTSVAFKIDANNIFSGYTNFHSFGSIVNPIILDANNTFTYDNDTLMSASGFLIDANADYTAVNSTLNNTAGSGTGVYTVPSGKMLVILNLYSEGSIYAKSPNTSAIKICNTQNSSLGNSINVTKKPIFLNEGDKIYGIGTFNGYLMDK